MLPLIVALSLFVVLSGVIVFYGVHKYARPQETIQKIAAPEVQTMGVYQAGTPGSHLAFKLTKMTQWVGEQMPADVVGASLTRRFLVAAGYNQPEAVAVLSGAKVLCALALAALASVGVTFVTWPQWVDLGVVAAAAGLGFFLPRLVLEHLVDRRQQEIRFALPDALDLMVVCAEAGLGLDQTLRVVADELAYTHLVLSREFSLVATEMRAGSRRSDALRNMAERTMVPELRQLTAIMVQTDRFGTSMADSLRTHADFTRMRRSQVAEEKAGKLGVKLIFPIFFCMLPAIIVLSVGPSAIRIAKELLPALREVK